MIKKLIAFVSVALAMSALFLGTAGTANASSFKTQGCTSLLVEYQSDPSNNYWVSYAEARNVCGAYHGHFNIEGVNGPDAYPISTFRVNINRWVRRGSYICGTGWRNNGGGNFTNMGSPCVMVG
jgi:hypothetical protein